MQPPFPTSSSGIFPAVPEIIFTNWREALHRTGLSPAIKVVYELALSGYLDYCGRNGVSVTAASAHAYMEDVTRRGLATDLALWKEGPLRCHARHLPFDGRAGLWQRIASIGTVVTPG